MVEGSPEQRLLEKADGRVTKFYPTKPQKAAKIAGLLKNHLRLADDQISIQADYEKSNVAPKSGEVQMRKNDCLTARDLESGWVLTCQSVPQTEDVHVSWDES